MAAARRETAVSAGYLKYSEPTMFDFQFCENGHINPAEPFHVHVSKTLFTLQEREHPATNGLEIIGYFYPREFFISMCSSLI